MLMFLKSKSALIFSRSPANKAITRQPESKPKLTQPMKRDRPRSSSTSASPRKKRKPAENSKKDPLRADSPVAHVSSSSVKSGQGDLREKNTKPSPHKSEISIRTRVKPSSSVPSKSIKYEPQPICSDLSHISIIKRTKPSQIIDLTGDTSDEQSGGQKSDTNLQRQLDDRTSELSDYRDSLHKATFELQELKQNNLLRKAAEQIDLEKRETETTELKTGLQKAKERNDQLAKVNRTLNERVNSQEAFDQQLRRYDLDIKNIRSSEEETKRCLEVEVAKSQALKTVNDKLEEKEEEHKVTISRLQTEVAKFKEELKEQKEEVAEIKRKFKEQKEESDWFEAKFLKFKRWYYMLEKEREEEAGILRRIMPTISPFAGVPLVQTRPVKDAISVPDRLEAENGSSAGNTRSEPLIPARDDELDGEAHG